MTLANIPQDIRNEFVVDQDGKVYAKSLRAVARLAGLGSSYSGVFNSTKNTGVLRNIAEADPTSNNLPNSLKPFTGMDFRATSKYPDTLVAAIVGYYAHDAKETNDIAKANFMAMAMVGFRAWFQQELGWIPKPVPVLTYSEALRQLADKLEYDEKLRCKHPGVAMLSPEVVEVLGLTLTFTIRQWLAYKGYVLDATQCKNFGKQVANTKRTLSLLKTVDANTQDHKVYTYSDLDFLEACWTSFIEE